ncbi:MAG: hypothetical protein A2167_02010 [Planctomycetes bacterium RBG_13_46_10]|nr:MAG: hypothetical protein A2167_02010 [Planctomycetes bacterium RBG_13_46_10]
MYGFGEIESFLRQHGWKLWGHWKCWAVFIKPNNPNERPLLVNVNPNKTIPPEEWDRINDLLS